MEDCPICGNKLADIHGEIKCPYCGWLQDRDEQDTPPIKSEKL